MNVLKEILKNQLIKLPAIRKKAQRSHVTGLNEKLETVEDVIQLYKKYMDPAGKRILELGPGQTHQVAERLMQEGAIMTIADIDQYLDPKLVADLGLDYHIYDGAKLPFEDETFDVILSHTVYEHIRYPETTVNETYRLLKKGGQVVHLVDLGDHFSYGVDESLLFNCLKYPKWVWNAMTWNRSNFVNRLRQSEWVQLHQHAGFTTIEKELDLSDFIQTLHQSGKLPYLDRYPEEDRYCKRIEIHCRK
ncbi:MAG: class I SAM-dependent methyltransferase [Bacteroidota bacterium]